MLTNFGPVNFTKRNSSPNLKTFNKLITMQKNVQSQKKRKSQTKVSFENTEGPQNYDMIVFCHLRWDFVYQRPQHLISRMSQNFKVLLIEEPIGYDAHDENSANLIVISENLHVLQPKVKDIESIASIIPEYIKNNDPAVGWFYSASFIPLLDLFKFETLVYDCMDELTLFKDATENLLAQEKYLMTNADIVFTGGKSLYECKKQHHSNVYCFPSSVDQKHFAQALNGVVIPNVFFLYRNL
jgi:hypothetical protein